MQALAIKLSAESAPIKTKHMVIIHSIPYKLDF